MLSTKECNVCGGELLKAHEDIGICNWCMIEIDQRQEYLKTLRPPSYCSVDDNQEKEDELPTPEEYM